jgi:exopolysaccharide production protein ExoQ
MYLIVNKQLNFIEQLFTILSLFIFSGGVLVLVLSGGQQEYEDVSYDSSLIRIAFFSIYTITFLLLVLRWEKTLDTLKQDSWIFLLVTIAVLSIIWSFEKSNTLKDTFTLVGSSLFGLYLASRYTLKEQLQLMSWTFGIAIILSFIFAIALPKFGIMGAFHQGKWRGVFSHKNGLGQSMVYSSLVFLFLTYQYKKYKLLMLIGMSLSILLLLLSASTSSLVNLLILICVFFILHTFRFPYLLMIPLIVLIVTIGEAFYFWSIDNAEVIFNSVGKDPTLTGRTELWQLTIDMIWQQPWLGYGYGGFWRGLNGAESGYILRAVSWTPSHPHNGYLQLFLDLGILGIVVFSVGIFTTLIRSVKFIRSTKAVDALWPIVHMIQILITSTTESQLFTSNNLGWILYVAAAFSLRSNAPPE